MLGLIQKKAVRRLQLGTGKRSTDRLRDFDVKHGMTRFDETHLSDDRSIAFSKKSAGTPECIFNDANS